MISAPFRPGDRILYLPEPWRGAWTVTGCELHAGGGWRVSARAGGAALQDEARHYARAPEGWEDPPSRPAYRGLLALADYGRWGERMSRDAEYQAALRRWASAYAAWAERCLPLVGDYAEHVAGARRMAAR